MTSDHEPVSSCQEKRSQSLDPELQQEQFWKRFKYDEEFLELLRPQSSSGRLLFAFIARNLRAFHLQSFYNEAYILNESYIRGAILLHDGGEIRILPAWLNKTCYNIIRELQREQTRTQTLDDYMLETQISPIAPESLEVELMLLSKAFEHLELKDQRLLNLKIIHGFSWKKIHEIFKEEGIGNFTEQALRKRKERALIRLRKQYHETKHSSEQP
jgi:hypothetical protein